MGIDLPRLDALPIRRGDRVLLRVDCNVPLSADGTIEDDLRITTVLPTIEYVRGRGGVLVLCAHLGRPKGKVDARYSMAPVAQRLQELLGATVLLAPAV